MFVDDAERRTGSDIAKLLQTSVSPRKQLEPNCKMINFGILKLYANLIVKQEHVDTKQSPKRHFFFSRLFPVMSIMCVRFMSRFGFRRS